MSKLHVTNRDILLFAALTGVADGYTVQTISARNTSVGTSVEEVSTLGGNITQLPAGQAAKISVNTTSVDDRIAGTGIQKMFLSGLDIGYQEISEVVDMDDASNLSSKDYHRVHECYPDEDGGDGVSSGVITAVSQFTGNPVLAQVDNELNESSISLRTIPMGKFGVIVAGIAAIEGNKSATAFGSARPLGKTWRSPVSFPLFSGSFPIKVIGNAPGETDIKVTAKAAVGGTGVTITYLLYLFDNSVIGF